MSLLQKLKSWSTELNVDTFPFFCFNFLVHTFYSRMTTDDNYLSSFSFCSFANIRIRPQTLKIPRIEYWGKNEFRLRTRWNISYTRTHFSITYSCKGCNPYEYLFPLKRVTEEFRGWWFNYEMIHRIHSFGTHRNDEEICDSSSK